MILHLSGLYEILPVFLCSFTLKKAFIILGLMWLEWYLVSKLKSSKKEKKWQYKITVAMHCPSSRKDSKYLRLPQMFVALQLTIYYLEQLHKLANEN